MIYLYYFVYFFALNINAYNQSKILNVSLKNIIIFQKTKYYMCMRYEKNYSIYIQGNILQMYDQLCILNEIVV